MGSTSISVDEFQALEAKVLQAVEIIRRERDARAAAESSLSETQAQLNHAHNELTTARAERSAAQAEAAELRDKLASASGNAQSEIESLHREREAVRLRVEKMLSQMDDLL
jgi:chromosome segregation ATPase